MNSIIYIILLLLPSYLIRFSLLGIPSTLLEILIYCLALVWIITKLKNRDLKISLKKIWLRLGPLAWPLALFFVSAGISLIISPNLKISAGIFKGWYFDALVFLIIFLDQIKTKQQLKKCVLALITSAVLISAYGLIEYLFGFGLDTDNRLNSIYPTANFVSLFTVPALIFLIGLSKTITQEKTKKNLVLLGGCYLLLIISLYLSKSYGGILALVGGLTYLDITSKHRSKGKASLLVIVVLLIFTALQFNTPKFQNLLKFDSGSSTASRLQIWQTSVYLIDQNPILGIGLGNFEQAYTEAVPDLFFPPLEWLVNKAHNLYLNLWLEMGALGLLAFLWLIWEFFRINKKQPSNYTFSAKAVMVAILIHGLVDMPLFKNDLMILWLIVLAIPLISQKLQNTVNH